MTASPPTAARRPLAAVPSPPAAPAASRRVRRVCLGLALLLTAAVLVPLWSVRHPPLQDYPYHLVRADVLVHWSDPARGFPEVFTRSFAPAPYVLADWLVAGLATAGLGVETAGKLVLSLYLVLFPWSFVLLARTLDPAGAARGAVTPVGLAGFLLVHHWHYHMGFVSYSLSLPVALAAIALWWRWAGGAGGGGRGGSAPGEAAGGRGGAAGLTAPRLLALAGLVTAVYLLHVYSFGILLFVVLVLAAVAGRRAGGAAGALRLAGRTLAAALPALALLARAVAAGGAGEGGGPLLLLYGGWKRKLLLAAGSFPSFRLAWETALLAAAVALLALLAALAWRRGWRPPAAPTAALGGLALLYLALPDHVGRVFFVSNRVPLYLLLLAAALVPSPRRRRAGLATAGLLALLALLHTGSLAVTYRAVDTRLADYRAALATLPPEARVGFRAGREAMAVGRIAPAALFGGYHYLEAPASRMPDLEHFVGNLRTVAYRDDGEALSTAAVTSPEELRELLARPWLVGKGGWMVALGELPGPLAEVARRQGFARSAELGPVAAWHRRRAAGSGAGAGGADRTAGEPVPAEGAEAVDAAWYATGYDTGWDHLVVFTDPDAAPPAAPPADPALLGPPVHRRGWAAVHRTAGSGAAVE